MRALSCCTLLALCCAGCSLTLGVDELSGGSGSCRDHASSASCRAVADLTPGSVGHGIALPWLSLPRYDVVGGLLHESELVVAVRVHGTDPMGALLGIHTADGTRRLISGWVQDADGTPTEAGSGSYLGDLRAVGSDADGWIAHSWQGFDFRGDLIRVDPASGKRSYLGNIGADCPEAVGAAYWPDDADSLVLGAGEVLVSVSGLDFDGVARVNADGCAPVPLDRNGPYLLARRDEKLVVADTTTGNVGTLVGDTISWLPSADAVEPAALAIDGAQAWLYLSAPTPALIQVDLATGSRTTFELGSGPARWAPERTPHLWPHPDGKRLLLELDGAIVVVDPIGGDSRTLSY